MAVLIFYVVVGICYVLNEVIHGVLMPRKVLRQCKAYKYSVLMAVCAEVVCSLIFIIGWPYFIIREIRN